jgi:integrase
MFLRWSVGRAVLDQSPAEGVPLPSKEIARDRVLEDKELAQILVAAREFRDPYGAIVEFLALSGQRREEVAGTRARSALPTERVASSRPPPD